MSEQLDVFFAQLNSTAEFSEVDFSDLSATASDGDNALHCAVRWRDLTAVKALIVAGIDLNKAGDLGYTPLHVACMEGDAEIVQVLIANGADIFALCEGYPPFTTARLSGHDNICDLLAPLMKNADPEVWIRARIAQLKREIDLLEGRLSRS